MSGCFFCNSNANINGNGNVNVNINGNVILFKIWFLG